MVQLPKSLDFEDVGSGASKRIIYMHMPKAGGTSIWEMLSESFGLNQSRIGELDSLTDPRTLWYIDHVQWIIEAANYVSDIPSDLKYL